MKTKSKLTDWFSPATKPPHVGWWHTGAFDLDPRGNHHKESYRNWWWDGKYWLTNRKGIRIYDQKRWWRGLLEQAK